MNLAWRFRPSSVLSRRLFLLTLALLTATSALIWLGYQATQDARRNAGLLLERRVSEQHALLWAGLSQDMKGAHATVLAPITPSQLVLEPPYDLAHAFARGFARFPYPEVFFAWKDSGNEPGITYVFSRTDRPPAWSGSERLGGPYPVSVARDLPAMGPLIADARQRARFGGPLAVFPASLGGTNYQVVVTYFYDDDAPMRVSGLVGFAVNLEWVRTSYFGELVSQIARIGGDPMEIALQVLDPAGNEVASTGPQRSGIAPIARSFPLVFVDRALLGVLPPGGSFDLWSARASVAATSSGAAATAGAGNAYLVASLAAILFVAGLTATVRSVRAAAELASMKSDFVSSVTHELKTPLAVIQLIADTLVRGRYRSPDAIQDYAGMLAREAQSLSSLVDNLLAYARLSDVKHAYAFEAVDVGDLVDAALEHVRALLVEGQFAVHVDIPPTLPAVRADRAAALLALDNILDNAIKYSGENRVVEIAAAVAERGVHITVQDRGAGIHEDDIDRVCEKFFRGRDTSKRGSGLGLAIVQHVIDAHGGTLRIRSRRGEGTRVEMVLPKAAA